MEDHNRSHILNRLVSSIVPPEATPDEQEGYMHRLLASTGLITMAFSLLYVAVSLVIGFRIGVMLMLACFLTLLAIMVLFRSTARYRLCSNLFLACCFAVAILGCSFFSGGIHSMVLPWFTLIPLTAVLLLGPGRDTVLWSILTCIVVFIFGLAGMHGYRFPLQYDTKYTAFFNMACIVGLVTILSLLAYVFGRNHKWAIVTINEQKSTLEGALAEIKQLAFYDSLTHLPNRRLFLDRLGHAIAESRRTGCFGALMFLDLDDFKPLNDVHGHEAGDLLLVEVARRLTDCMRETDTVARYGGDEFAIVLHPLDADPKLSQAKASIVAQKISTVLSDAYALPIQNHGRGKSIVHHSCTASIGIVLFFGHEVEQSALIHRADEAMYLAKSAGKNAIRIYPGD